MSTKPELEARQSKKPARVRSPISWPIFPRSVKTRQTRARHSNVGTNCAGHRVGRTQRPYDIQSGNTFCMFSDKS
ncbi:unnamed protein product [Cochlearia groenlandica]